MNRYILPPVPSVVGLPPTQWYFPDGGTSLDSAGTLTCQTASTTTQYIYSNAATLRGFVIPQTATSITPNSWQVPLVQG